MFIFRRFNCICNTSGTVTLCERPYFALVKRELDWSSSLLTSVTCGRSQRVKVPDAVHIQLNLLKVSIIMLETCKVK